MTIPLPRTLTRVFGRAEVNADVKRKEAQDGVDGIPQLGSPRDPFNYLPSGDYTTPPKRSKLRLFFGRCCYNLLCDAYLVLSSAGKLAQGDGGGQVWRARGSICQ